LNEVSFPVKDLASVKSALRSGLQLDSFEVEFLKKNDYNAWWDFNYNLGAIVRKGYDEPENIPPHESMWCQWIECPYCATNTEWYKELVLTETQAEEEYSIGLTTPATECLFAMSLDNFIPQSWGEAMCFVDTLIAARIPTYGCQMDMEAKAVAFEKKHEEEILDWTAIKAKQYADSQKGKAQLRIKYGKAATIFRPCKNLYVDENPKVPKVRHKDGRMVCQERIFLTGSECWAWDYTDPKTKVKKAPHTCVYLHPGQEGWNPAWERDKNIKVCAPSPLTKQWRE